MAKLSNINGKFAVEDTGAIRFSDQTGTTGQILKSNGNSAPTWVDPNTVGTGPWLPLAGGVVSGPTTFQSSLTVGGLLTGANATFNGLMKLDAGGILQFAANTATPSMGVAIHRSAADTLNFVTASTNRLTIDGLGNVGVGLDPVYKLDVRGDRIRLNPNSNGFVTSEIQNTTGSFYFGIDNSTGTGFGGANSARCIFSLGDYPMAFYTNSTERMRIDNAGRVAFGPDALDIQIDPASTNSGNNLIYMRGNASDDKSSLQMNHFGYADYYIGVGHVGNGKFNIANDLTGNDFVIDTSGNVGIGIDTPTLVAGKIVHIHGVAAGVHLTDTASGTTSGDGGYVAFDNPNLYIQNKEAGSMFFETSGTTALTINSSGNATFSGQVKIDSTAGYKLNVEDSASFLFYGATDATTGSVFRLRSNNKAVTIVDIDAAGNSTFAGNVSIVDDKYFAAGTGGDLIIRHLSSDNSSYIQSYTGDFYFDNRATTKSMFFRVSNSSAGDTTAVTIKSNGNVGIGVTNPDARLELDNPSAFTNMIEYGNVAWNNNTGHGLVAVNRGSDGYVQLQITSGVDNADVFTIRNSGTGANIQHNFLSNGNAYHAGNVGIGVAADVSVRTFIKGSDSGTNNFQILTRNSNDENILAVRNDGNVGIGTTSPSSFSGYTNLSLKAGSTGNNLDFFNSSGTRIGAIVTDGSDDVILEASGLSRNLIFKTDNAGTFSEKMRITSGGYIKSPPTYSLTTSTAANMHVDSNGFFYRSTSSLKYKADVRDYDKGLNEVMQLQPKYYKGKTDGDKQFAGLIAEDVHDLGLTEFVQYADDGSPDALSYSHMVALLVKSIQELKADNDILKARIKILENK